MSASDSSMAPEWGRRQSFVQRVLGALKLDAATYSEVEHDEDALGQAIGVVVLAALGAALGASGSEAGGGIVGAALGAVIGWLVSAGFVWVVGVRFLDHTSDYGELLRTLGFASAPQILLLFGVVPLLGSLLAFVVIFWGLAAYVVAVREALDVDTGRAVVVCLLAYGVKLALVLAMFLVIAAAAGTLQVLS